MSNVRRKLKWVVLTSSIVVSATGCTGLVQHSMFGSEEGGYVSIQADKAGMNALSDWQTGTINEVRTPSGTKGSYFQLREEQTRNKTIRLKLRKGGK